MNNNVDRRIYEHPILGPLVNREVCTIVVDGKPIQAYLGEPVLAALIASGIIVARRTEKKCEPRGLFCGIGLCADCLVSINGRRNVRSCITPVEEGMVIETQFRGGRHEPGCM